MVGACFVRASAAAVPRAGDARSFANDSMAISRPHGSAFPPQPHPTRPAPSLRGTDQYLRDAAHGPLAVGVYRAPQQTLRLGQARPTLAILAWCDASA